MYLGPGVLLRVIRKTKVAVGELPALQIPQSSLREHKPVCRQQSGFLTSALGAVFNNKVSDGLGFSFEPANQVDQQLCGLIRQLVDLPEELIPLLRKPFGLLFPAHFGRGHHVLRRDEANDRIIRCIPDEVGEGRIAHAIYRPVQRNGVDLVGVPPPVIVHCRVDRRIGVIAHVVDRGTTDDPLNTVNKFYGTLQRDILPRGNTDGRKAVHLCRVPEELRARFCEFAGFREQAVG